MLTASQLRAACALTNISLDDLSVEAGVSVDAIRKAEASDMHSDPALAERLRMILETKGVIFLGAGEGDASAGPGVRLRRDIQEEGIRPQNLNAANDG